MPAPYRIFGIELSPYSVKVRSYFRYKGIPHEWVVRHMGNMEEFQKFAKLPLVPLVITPEGGARFLGGGVSHKATHYRMKIEIGGILGFVAPLVGKQPQDSHAWVLDGNAPGFVRMEGPLFADGPSWRIEPASPVWQGPLTRH